MLDRELGGSEPSPLPDYTPDGIDLSLIRWSLSLTPAERLALLEIASRTFCEFVLSMQESKSSLCLTALKESDAEFVLVGGLAAVLQGAPVQTYDVDIVYSRV